MPISAAEPLLLAGGLSAGYGKIAVLHGIDLKEDAGEVVVLLGPNGAGKTTLLRAKTQGVTPDEQFRRLSETIPLRRTGQPNEIGDLCGYLCSPQVGYITGQTIVVDGGINRSI
jgi:ABC-type multidrug transport system ATPase subunit